MSELFKVIKNTVVSTTGSSVTDKDISLIIYLYEQAKKESELKQCSKCSRWKEPLNSSACSYSLVKAQQLNFKVNKKGMMFCDDFKSKLEKGE